MSSLHQQRQEFARSVYEHFGRRSRLGGRGTHSLAAWFLGPKAENQRVMQELLALAFEKHCDDRRDYRPDDPVFVTDAIRDSRDYNESLATFRAHLEELLTDLRGSIPLSSYRNQSHMYWDVTMPGVVGYFAAMLYNQNNVAAEASPVTTALELEVGDDLCRMLGYDVVSEEQAKNGAIKPWGHITCDGSVANSEAMWAARNLKYFPISVARALRDEPALADARDLTVPLPAGGEAVLTELDTWQLLNLGVDDVIGLSRRIRDEKGIAPDALQAALGDYTVQNLGLAEFTQRFAKDSSAHLPAIMTPSTNHYSWPKAASLLGLGKNTVEPIHVDLDCRMDAAHLRARLDACLEQRRPVIQVVAVIGTTEESAVDPLDAIVDLREEYRLEGLEFALHLDAAWGGYFASMLRRDEHGKDRRSELEPTPVEYLSRYVRKQFDCFPHADSITVDPHKSGFIPYPAGALCYRNGTMRELVTFTAPVVYHGGVDPTVGVYGIEGSKPGAAAAGVHLSHRVIPTNENGYGKLLGKCLWNSKRLYAEVLTMARPEDPFIVEPVQRLPAYRDGEAHRWPKDRIRKEADEQFALIRDYVVKKSNAELLDDKKALRLFARIGADLSIIGYAFNLKLEDGTLNRDVARANELNNAIYQKLSISRFDPNEVGDVPPNPMFVTSSEFTEAGYGRRFVDHYMGRLGLDRKTGDTVRFLISTTQDPWVSEVEAGGLAPDGNFIPVIVRALRETVIECIAEMRPAPGDRATHGRRRGKSAPGAAAAQED